MAWGSPFLAEASIILLMVFHTRLPLSALVIIGAIRLPVHCTLTLITRLHIRRLPTTVIIPLPFHLQLLRRTCITTTRRTCYSILQSFTRRSISCCVKSIWVVVVPQCSTPLCPLNCHSVGITNTNTGISTVSVVGTRMPMKVEESDPEEEGQGITSAQEELTELREEEAWSHSSVTASVRMA